MEKRVQSYSEKCNAEPDSQHAILCRMLFKRFMIIFHCVAVAGLRMARRPHRMRAAEIRNEGPAEYKTILIMVSCSSLPRAAPAASGITRLPSRRGSASPKLNRHKATRDT